MRGPLGKPDKRGGALVALLGHLRPPHQPLQHCRGEGVDLIIWLLQQLEQMLELRSQIHIILDAVHVESGACVGDTSLSVALPLLRKNGH